MKLNLARDITLLILSIILKMKKKTAYHMLGSFTNTSFLLSSSWFHRWLKQFRLQAACWMNESSTTFYTDWSAQVINVKKLHSKSKRVAFCPSLFSWNFQKNVDRSVELSTASAQTKIYTFGQAEFQILNFYHCSKADDKTQLQYRRQEFGWK